MSDDKPFSEEELKNVQEGVSGEIKLLKEKLGPVSILDHDRLHRLKYHSQRLLDTIAADRKRIEELMGGIIPGHKLNCSDCGRAMVWSRTGGAWMCPNCVLHRCDTAEDRVRFLDRLIEKQTATIERLRGALEKIWNLKSKAIPCYTKVANDSSGQPIDTVACNMANIARQVLDGKEK